jgi:hypothetical protein
MEAAVVGYLQRHPRAMDTFEGIATEWLLRHHFRVEIDLLVRVLDQLTRRHVLERVETGGAPCYRLAAAAPAP